jgi:major membrane immunogen (membrane-anchored lipoprotein)
MLMPTKLIDCMVENQNPELVKVVSKAFPSQVSVPKNELQRLIW